MSKGSGYLVPKLQQVDWVKNVNDFSKQSKLVGKVEAATHTVAVWGRQFEVVDKSNMALPFIREMQVQSHCASVCIGAALYRAASASVRGMLESALYYSYFRSHFEELDTLVRDVGFYIDKSFIIDYHKKHTRSFTTRQQALDLLSQLDSWYKKVSAMVHGQVPGGWTIVDIEKTSYNSKDASEIISIYESGCALVNLWFLATVNDHCWDGISREARTLFLEPIPASRRKDLSRPLV